MKLAASFFVLLLMSGIYAASAESIISIEIDTDTLTPGKIIELTGSVESSLAGKSVGIEVKGSDGEIILIRSITSNSNGDFTLKFKVPSSASGELEIITSVEIDGQPFSVFCLIFNSLKLFVGFDSRLFLEKYVHSYPYHRCYYTN